MLLLLGSQREPLLRGGFRLPVQVELRQLRQRAQRAGLRCALPAALPARRPAPGLQDVARKGLSCETHMHARQGKRGSVLTTHSTRALTCSWLLGDIRLSRPACSSLRFCASWVVEDTPTFPSQSALSMPQFTAAGAAVTGAGGGDGCMSAIAPDGCTCRVHARQLPGCTPQPSAVHPKTYRMRFAASCAPGCWLAGTGVCTQA